MFIQQQIFIILSSQYHDFKEQKGGAWKIMGIF